MSKYGYIAVILIIGLAGTVSAGSSLDGYFIVNDVQGMPGDTITIPVKVQNVANIGSMDMSINTALNCPHGLTISSIEKGSLTNDALFDWTGQGQTYAKFSFASSKPIAGSGTIVNIKIKVGDSAPYEASADYNSEKKCPMSMGGEVFDTNGKSNGYHAAIVSYTPGWAIKGDGDHDGQVTSKDALAALQMAIGKIPENKDYDMTGDGKVKSNDVQEILKVAVSQPSSLLMVDLSGGQPSGTMVPINNNSGMVTGAHLVKP